MNTKKANSRLHNYKALFLLLLAFAGITNVMAQDLLDEVINDKLKYKVVGRDRNNLCVTVVGHVDGEKAQGEIVIPDMFLWEGKECVVTHIGFFSFENCQEITSVHIPNTVIGIECKAFYGCSKLTSVTIPNSVVQIEEDAFTNTGWYNLQPDGILYLDNCCLGYKGDKPRGNLILKEDTRLIADKSFFECADLIGSLVIPDKVTAIGSSAFWSCSGFNGNIIIGRSVVEIHHGAFENCNGLIGDLTIPQSVKLIDVCAFKNCSGLNGELVIENPNTKMEGDVLMAVVILQSDLQKNDIDIVVSLK